MANKKHVSRTSTEISIKKREIFLDHLAQTGNVAKSSRAVGYADSTYLNRIRRADKEFDKLWNEAIQAHADVLEAEATRRAMDGVMEPVFYKGEVAGYKKNYSDALMMFMLRGARPEKYNRQGGDTNVNVKFGIAVLPMASKNDDTWEKDALVVHDNQELIVLEEKPKETVIRRAD